MVTPVVVLGIYILGIYLLYSVEGVCLTTEVPERNQDEAPIHGKTDEVQYVLGRHASDFMGRWAADLMGFIHQNSIKPKLITFAFFG